METIFKKYFWVVNILVLLLMSYMTATLINEYIGSKFFIMPQLVMPELEKKKPEVASSKDKRMSKSIPSDTFNSDKVDEKVAVNEDEEKDEENEEDKENTGELAETELDIALLGTLVSDDVAWSLATIDTSAGNKLFRVGMNVEDKAEVIYIARRYVLLKEEGKTTILKFGKERKKGRGRTPIRPNQPVAPTRVSAAPSRARQDYSKSVTKTGDYEWSIDRNMLEENLNDLSSLGMQARIVPNYRGGKYEGFKLVGVRPDSLYRAIGIRSGDVIKTINGEPIDSPNKAITMFEKFKSSSNISIGVERRGQLKDFGYVIK